MKVVDGARQFVLGAREELEVVDKFCYLGDVIGKGGDAEEASRARVRCAWGKFRDLRMLLTARRASLRVKGKIYTACVQRVLVYGSETWPMKVNDMQRLVRTENSMVRWMSGVTLKDRRKTKDLREGLGIESVDRVVRKWQLDGLDMWIVKGPMIGFLSADVWRWWVVWGRGGIGRHG